MTPTAKLQSLTNRLNAIVKALATETDPEVIEQMFADIRDLAQKIQETAN